jgi:hypothetical protein
VVISMKAVLNARSQNGRWGVQIVCKDEAARFPAQGSLRPLGRSAGITCFEFVPGETGTWVVTGGDLDKVQGPVEVAAKEDLQGGDSVTVLVCRPGAAWRSFGYRRRGSSWQMLTGEGSIIEPPVGVLLAAGVIQPAEVPAEDVILPPEPDPESPMLCAMRKAGLI